jgi:hypothetical protein
MSETATRARWTDHYLDDLNKVVDDKTAQLDESVREIRADIKQLRREMDSSFDSLHGVGATRGHIPLQAPGPFDRQRLTTKTELWPGGRWTDGRIDDLRRTATTVLTSFGEEVHECRGEIENLRSELKARFAEWDRPRRWIRRRTPHVGAPPLPPRRTPVAPIGPFRSEAWTDGRLDDFNHSVDVGLERLERDVKEVQGEVENLRREMKSRLHAREAASWDFQKRTLSVVLCAVSGAVVLTVAVIAVIAAESSG